VPTPAEDIYLPNLADAAGETKVRSAITLMDAYMGGGGGDNPPTLNLR